MTVGELRKLLARLEEDMEILANDSEINYVTINFNEESVILVIEDLLEE